MDLDRVGGGYCCSILGEVSMPVQAPEGSKSRGSGDSYEYFYGG